MREWLMARVAGKRPYWIADYAVAQFTSLKLGVLGAGATIALVDSLSKAGVQRAEFRVGEWTVTAARIEMQDNIDSK